MKRTAVLPAPDRASPLFKSGKWNEEFRAFLRLHRSLLRSHQNQYVAVHQGKVVDSGPDKVALALRVYTQFDYVPIYVGQVSTEPRRAVRIPSPRRQRTRAPPVIRYRYNPQISPLAPFVDVTLQSTEGELALADLPAQIDTAADMTVLPASLVDQLRLVQLDAIPVVAFGGIRRTFPTFLVRLTLRGQGR